jgi:isopropylmalate/homocitrate/citramalate synthase
VEACNQLTIHPRHPYGGRLALAARSAQSAALGLIDPAELGRVAG